MENRNMSATLKYALVSDKKMSLMAQLVRRKSTEKAMEMLQFMPKKSAQILLKVIKSAYANATKTANANPETLYIQSIQVGRAPKLKRVRFTSRSRISHYAKYRSFVRVVLHNK